ncbi:MAG: efflux RND transporter periplasmic adaptor subunit [Gammaproteobacteria bacterium]|jgi:membrane fusion protein (multidrug efflux system)
MTKRMLLVLLALGLVLGAIFGWKYYQGQKMAALASMPPPPATVAAAEVQTETWQPYLAAVGSLVAIQGILVTTEVAGKVSAIHFESGQQVAAGTLLLEIDDSVEQAELEGIVAERRLAELQFKRREDLLDSKTISRSDVDEAGLRLENAIAQLAAKRAVIAKKQISAPFSGWLGIRHVDLGEYLQPGTTIVPLEALLPIYVDYALPERHLDQISVGQSIEVEVQAFPGEVFTGRISALDPAIDPGTRSLQVRATLENPQARLRPGMFAEVRTVLPQRPGVLTLPQTAITYNPYGDSVFVIQEGESGASVQRRQVETGGVRNGRVEIVQGLQAGERVVSAGQVKLRNEQPVVVDNSIVLDTQITRP